MLHCILEKEKEKKGRKREKIVKKREKFRVLELFFLSIVGKRQHNSVPSFVMWCAK